MASCLKHPSLTAPVSYLRDRLLFGGSLGLALAVVLGHRYLGILDTLGGQVAAWSTEAFVYLAILFAARETHVTVMDLITEIEKPMVDRTRSPFHLALSSSARLIALSLIALALVRCFSNTWGL